MILTNKHNLPPLLYAFLLVDFYDYAPDNVNTKSATQLIRPVQEVVLTERYDDEIEVDVIDRLWALLGQGIHAVLENLDLDSLMQRESNLPPGVREFLSNFIPKYKQAIKEKRLSIEFEDFTIRGKFDVIFENHLHDYKSTSTYKIKIGEYDDWILQLSIYRWLFMKVEGVKLEDTGFTDVILRDWSQGFLDHDRTGKYPKIPIQEIAHKLWSFDEVESYIKSRLTAIKESRSLMDYELSPCTDKDRWMGWDRKKKKNVFRKCKRYCYARKFCHQYRADKGEQII